MVYLDIIRGVLTENLHLQVIGFICTFVLPRDIAPGDGFVGLENEILKG